jgi:hypothetical protein
MPQTPPPGPPPSDLPAEAAAQAAPPVQPLAGQEIAVAMRFSFFGASGWQSGFSRDKALLFDPARLEARLRLFERVALASLAAQSDAGLHLFVLTSADLPEPAMARLRAACARRLGEGRFTLHARPPGPARRFLRMFLTARYGAGRCVQVVLDDDDGLAVDFIARLRPHLAALDAAAAAAAGGTTPGGAEQGGAEQGAADAAPPVADRPAFLSFVNGFGMVLPGGDPAGEPELYRHRYPYINLGLTMVSRSSGENLFSIDHRAAPRKHGCRMVRGAPMFVRTVHGLNDSRVSVTGRWAPERGWRSLEEVRLRFPYLLDLGQPRAGVSCSPRCATKARSCWNGWPITAPSASTGSWWPPMIATTAPTSCCRRCRRRGCCTTSPIRCRPRPRRRAGRRRWSMPAG